MPIIGLLASGSIQTITLRPTWTGRPMDEDSSMTVYLGGWRCVMAYEGKEASREQRWCGEQQSAISRAYQ